MESLKPLRSAVLAALYAGIGTLIVTGGVAASALLLEGEAAAVAAPERPEGTLADFVESFHELLHSDLETAASLAAGLGEKARSEGDRAALAIALALEAEAALLLDGVETSGRLLARAESVAPEGDALCESVILYSWAKVRSIQGDDSSALETVAASIGALETLSLPRLDLCARLLEFELLISISPLADAERRLVDLQRRLARDPIPDMDLWVEHARYVLLWHQGRFEEAEATLHGICDRAEPEADLQLWSEAHYDLAYGAWDGMQAEDALEAVGIAYGAMLTLGNLEGQGRCLELEACALRDAGRLSEALARAREALERVEGRGYALAETEAAGTASALAAELGDPVAVLELSEQHRKSWEELEGNIHWDELRNVRVELERADRERREASAWNERAMTESRARVRRQIGITLAVALISLATLVAVLLIGRVRLERSNGRLREEMRLAREAEAARREMEQKMRQVERLQGLGLIAGGIAHDFNNLLVGVLGNAELLLRRRRLPPEESRMLQEIVDSAGRAGALCQQLLAYAGKAPLARGPIELNGLTERLVPVLEAAVSHGVRIVVQLAPSPIWVAGDGTQIEQALLNLVKNAHDAQAGSVHVRVRRERLGREELDRMHLGPPGRPGEFATLEVADDGHGMTEEVLSHIFDPFFSTRFPGRGLGLAAVFGIVRRHRGVLDASSRPNEGTRFRLCLPTASATAPPLERAPVEGNGRLTVEPGHETVLVVDDEEAVSTLADRMLRTLDLGSITAKSAGEALSTVEREGDSLGFVLLDVTMPGGDGHQILPELRERAPDVPVVLMSGHSENDVLERCGATRPDALLSKPFNRESLRAALVGAQQARRRAQRTTTSSASGT